MKDGLLKGTIMSKKVEIMVVGAQKCGTTSLHDILSNHPQLELPFLKELYFFTNSKQYANVANFHQHYKFLDGKVAMNITPNNMCHPHAMQRIYDYNPQMKIVVMLREPTARCISQYKMRERTLKEKRSFKEVVNFELNDKNLGQPDCLSIVYRSMYDLQIQGILDVFPRNQVYFILFEDFVKDQQKSVNDLLAWCNLSSFSFEPVNSNESFYPKKTLIWRLLMKFPARYLRYIQTKLNVNIRQNLKDIYKKRGTPPIIDIETIHTLQAFFKERIDETERLTGLNLDVWRNMSFETRIKTPQK